MADQSIPQTAPARYYRIRALCAHDSTLLHIATGVAVLADGRAVLGQIRADPDDGSFIIAPLLTPAGRFLPAPLGWEASVISDPAPRPPSGGRGLIPFPVRALTVGRAA